MRKNAYIYLHGSTYFLVDNEQLVPPNKIAARVSLTGDRLASLMKLQWREYQSLLEHYFDIGQKLVTA
jgi:hypothetical protein